jgi:hypothetical protein
MLKIWDANNFRRTLAGLCLITAPLVFGGSDLMRIVVTGGKEGGAQLATIAAKPTLWQAVTLLDLLGIVLFVPAVLGLMHLLRDSSTVLSHVGGGLALIGFLGWACHNVAFYEFFGVASTSEIARGQILQFIGHWVATPSAIAWTLMTIVGFLLGMLLLSIGVYRARVVPRWAAGAFFLSMVINILAGFSPWSQNIVLLAVVWGLLFVGLGMIGLRVLAMSDADWVQGKHKTEAQPRVR